MNKIKFTFFAFIIIVLSEVFLPFVSNAQENVTNTCQILSEESYQECISTPILPDTQPLSPELCKIQVINSFDKYKDCSCDMLKGDSYYVTVC